MNPDIFNLIRFNLDLFMPGKKKIPPKKPRISKLNAWLFHFTDSSNKRAFLNRKESARAAGYKTENEESLRVIGHQNFLKLTDKIDIWLDEVGLSENALKIKLLSLVEAEETKFINIKGVVDMENLPNNAQVIVSGKTTKYTKEGERYDDIESVIGLNIENKELQRRSLDMAIKVKGMYAAEKREHTGPGGTPLEGKWEINVVMPK